MSNDENKALVRQFIEDVFHKRNLDMLDHDMAVDIVEHDPLPVEASGIEGQKQFFAIFLSAFPDFQIGIDDLVAEGDMVVARQTFGGTHQGEFLGIAPTGKHFSISGIDMVRFADGKVVEHWSALDNLGMMQQLGIIPTPTRPPRKPAPKADATLQGQLLELAL